MSNICVYCNEPLDEDAIEMGVDAHEWCCNEIAQFEEYNSIPDGLCPSCKTVGKIGHSCIKCDFMIELPL